MRVAREAEPALLREGARTRKKNTKRWCKGKPGIEHEFQWEHRYHHGSLAYYADRCQVCGKERDWWFEHFITSPMPQSLVDALKT